MVNANSSEELLPVRINYNSSGLSSIGSASGEGHPGGINYNSSGLSSVGSANGYLSTTSVSSCASSRCSTPTPMQPPLIPVEFDDSMEEGYYRMATKGNCLRHPEC